jgi:hypothetical protein
MVFRRSRSFKGAPGGNMDKFAEHPSVHQNKNKSVVESAASYHQHSYRKKMREKSEIK